MVNRSQSGVDALRAKSERRAAAPTRAAHALVEGMGTAERLSKDDRAKWSTEIAAGYAHSEKRHGSATLWERWQETTHARAYSTLAERVT